MTGQGFDSLAELLEAAARTGKGPAELDAEYWAEIDARNERRRADAAAKAATGALHTTVRRATGGGWLAGRFPADDDVVDGQVLGVVDVVIAPAPTCPLLLPPDKRDMLAASFAASAMRRHIVVPNFVRCSLPAGHRDVVHRASLSPGHEVAWSGGMVSAAAVSHHPTAEDLARAEQMKALAAEPVITAEQWAALGGDDS